MWTFNFHLFTIKKYLSTVSGICSKYGSYKLRSSGSYQSGKSKYLSFIQFKIDIFKMIVGICKVFHFQNGIFRHRLIFMIIFTSHVTANHHFYQLCPGYTGNICCINVFSISKYSYSVTYIENFFHSMGNVDDCLSLFFQFLYNFK